MMFQPANIRRKAKQELARLRQKSAEPIKECILWFHQCVIEAQYNTVAHGRFLIQILRNAIKQELVEFIEISQVQLIDSDKLDDWVHALIQVEWIKTKQRLGRLPQLAIPMPPQGPGMPTPGTGQITSARTIRAKTPSPTSWRTRLWLLLPQNLLHQQQSTQVKLAPSKVRAPRWIYPRLVQKASVQNTLNCGHVRTT